jgi:hypothetical protein
MAVVAGHTVGCVKKNAIELFVIDEGVPLMSAWSR